MFKIDYSEFADKNVILKNLLDSQSIQIKLRNLHGSINKIISLEPNYQASYPNFIPFHKKIINHDKKSKNNPEIPLYPTPEPIPMSVGLGHMKKISGDFQCTPIALDVGKSNEIGCDSTNLNSPSAYQCGYKCNSTNGILQ